MAVNAPFGLSAAQGPSRVREYLIPQSDTLSYGFGDLVKLVAGASDGHLADGRVSRGMGQVTKASPADVPCGFIVGFGSNPGAPNTLAIPTAKLAAHTVLVEDHPSALFTIQADNSTALATSAVHKTGQIAVGAPSGNYSTTVLASATLSSGPNPIRVIGLADSNASFGPYARLLCGFTSHEFAIQGFPGILSIAPGSLVPASKFGLVAGTADMTAQLSSAVNSAAYDNLGILLGPGNYNISGLVTASESQSQIVETYQGDVDWTLAPRLCGYGPYATSIIQNQAGVGCILYAPAAGNISQARVSNLRFANANVTLADTGQFGVQFGGVPGRGIVGEGIRIDSVSGHGLYAVIRCDDVTGLYVRGVCQNALYRYYIEAGYNADDYEIADFFAVGDYPIDVSCTNTSGTPTLSAISAAVTPFLFPGMGVTGAGIPANAEILSVGASSVTLSANTTGNVSTFDSHSGSILSLLGTTGTVYTGSGMATIANAAGWFNKTRASNPNIITMRNVHQNRGRALIEDYGGAYGLGMRQCYVERPQRIFLNQNANLKSLDMDIIHVSQGSSLRQPAIRIEATTPTGRIHHLLGDGSFNSTTTVELPFFTTPNEAGDLSITGVQGNVTTGGGPALQADFAEIVLGNSRSGSARYEHAGSNGNLNWDALGVDVLYLYLNHAATTSINLVNPGSVNPPKYKRIMVFLEQVTGDARVAFGSKFLFSNGSAIGSGIGASASAGTKALINFVYDGASFIGDRTAFAFV